MRRLVTLVTFCLVIGAYSIEQQPDGAFHAVFEESAYAATCTPRSPVHLAVTQSGGRLQVTITAGSGGVQQLRFGTATNALIDAGTVIGSAGGFNVAFPAHPASVAFSVRQAQDGAVTVPVVVVDDCGDWPTFVGGGASSWPTATPAPVNTLPPTATPTAIPTSAVPATPTRTSTPTSGGGLTFQDLDGRATLLSADNTFIGDVSSNQFATNSVCNKFGTYGSQFSSASVRNPFGTYGSQFSNKSAYNQFATLPPAIVYQGTIVGFLTKNQAFSSRADPDALFAAYGCT